MRVPPPTPESGDDEFKPLSREQARQWRQAHPQVSALAVLLGQTRAMAAVALLAWLASGNWRWAAELAYGAAAIVMPSALMLWALLRGARRSDGQARSALTDFFLWEGVKLVLSIGMMALTPVWFDRPSWLALLVGVLLALKAHWLAAWWLSVRLRRNVHG